jgi:hypothetical protein
MGVPTIGPVFVLTQVSNAVFPYLGSPTGSTTYTGTVTGGAASATQPNGAYAGQAFIITGFTSPSNNGTFRCVFSSATTLVLSNRNGTAVVAAGQAQLVIGHGTPLQYASKISNLASNDQGDNVYVSPLAGDTLVAIAFGLKSLDPFDQLHGASTHFGYLQGLNDFMPNAPTISDNSTFTPESPLAVRLGTAANYALLAYSGITNTGASVISGGNIGSAPTTGTESGFTFVSPAAIDNANAAAARTAGNTAFTYYSGLAQTMALTTADIGSSGTQHSPGAPNGTYYAGVYVSGSSIAITTAVTLDAQNNPNALFVFYATASTITQAIAGTITLINGATPDMVVWVVGSSWTTTGPGAVTVGNILAYTSITLGGGSLNGRALAVGGGNGAVTIAAATAVTVPSLGGSANNWVLVANINLADADYSGYSIPPLANTSWPAADWSIDGYYPSLYIWVCASANAGSYNVNLNSVYQNGISAPLDLAAGKPIFDGGINFQVIDWTGMTGATIEIGGSPASDSQVAITAANPAVTAPIVTSGGGSPPVGDLVIVVGLQKNANGLGLGTDSTMSTYSSSVNAELGTAANYALLAYSGITNASASTSVTGGVIGSAPTMTETGFNPPVVTIDNADAAAARLAGNAAFGYYSGLTATQSGLADLSANDGGGGAGVYYAGVFKGGAFLMPTGITLDAQGNSNAVFVFVASSTVNLASGQSVTLVNGAQASNVIWVVGSSFTSVANSNMVGDILAYTSITLGGGTLVGRALAVGGGNGAVSISATTVITVPSGSSVVTNGGYNMVSSGKLVGSEAHYLVEWGVQGAPGSWTPQFANPLGYETLIAAVAISHS